MKTAGKLTVIGMVFCMVLASSCRTRIVDVDPENWEFLGKREVNFIKDTDIIRVTGSEGTFRRLMFTVQESSLEMFDITIVFGDGQTYSPPSKLNFRQGNRSRIIDLPGKRRVIRRVTFKYRSTRLRTGKATIELYGK